MNSTRIGDIGVANMVALCLEKNIPVYLPFSDNEKADLIILLDNIPKKVQVKTALKDNGDVVYFNTCSSTSAIYKRKSVAHKYTAEEVDYYALYNIARKEMYLVPFEECGGRGIQLRYTETKNNQKAGIKWARDYLF